MVPINIVEAVGFAGLRCLAGELKGISQLKLARHPGHYDYKTRGFEQVVFCDVGFKR